MTEDVEACFSFGTWVRRRRKALDLTQAALAQRVGCAEITIRKIEADAVRPSREIAERLASCLDIPLDHRDGFIAAARAERSVERVGSPLAGTDMSPPSLAPPSPTQPLPLLRPGPINAAPPPRLDRNRQAMLTKIQAIWITGLLNQSLYQDVVLTLQLTACPGAVLSPLDRLVQRPHPTVPPLPAGTAITDVFDHMGGALLILGAPGAGKTTLLLDLLRALLLRAEHDPTHPIPVVFLLSTWSERRPPLRAWLVDELTKRYGVPRKLAHTWVHTDQILPLLDGLDEVAPNDRTACVEAINRYHQAHGLLPLVVCSRGSDYDALPVQLQLLGAVQVQPLTPSQIATYLRAVGPPVAAVQHALCADPSLGELLDTPLMLHIVTLTYAGQSVATLQAQASSDERRHHLFATYVTQMLARGNAQHSYTPTQTIQWLGWLAWQMQRHNQTVFYLERMQPDWLPHQQQWLPTRGVGLFVGLVAGLYAVVFTGLIDGLIAGVAGGVASVVVVGFFFGYSKTIKNVEVLQWSPAAFRSRLWLSVSGGVATGLLFGLTDALMSGLIGGVLAGLVFALIGGLTTDEVELRSVVKQGIQRSLQHALLIGLLVGMLFGLADGLFFGPVVGALDGLFVGLIVSLWYGGRTYLQHHVLHRLLVHNGTAPWNYPHFLDYAAQRIFLRKVGGGYMFIHRLLLEHFAVRYAPNPATSAPAHPLPSGDSLQ